MNDAMNALKNTATTHATRVQFRAVLWGLGWRLKQRSHSHAKLQKALADKNVVLQCQTEDARVARYYQIQKGRVESIQGIHSSPTACVMFVDAAYAMQLCRRPSLNGFMAGIQDKQILMSGDYSVLMWFMKVASYLR